MPPVHDASSGPPGAHPGIDAKGLALRHREPLVRYFRRRGLAADAAEDCAQEVFARILGLEELGHIENVEAYLFRIAGSVLIDHGRRGRARGAGLHVPLEDITHASEDPSPARVFEGKEAFAQLRAALSELPAQTREIFLLNRLDGLTYAALAARYGVSVSAIEKRMMKAIAHLHQRLRPD